MPLREFLAAIQETGRVKVAGLTVPAGEETAGADEVLAEMDAAARLEFPGEAPPLSLHAARWGALLLYRACQFLVFREAGEEKVRAELGRPCPEPAGPPACWSADLCLRHLPDLLTLARGVSEGDVLVSELLRLAREWPLCGVGVESAGEANLSAFADHPGLVQVYVDRIIERKDLARLSNPRVREAAAAALGAHPGLCPPAAAALARVIHERGS